MYGDSFLYCEGCHSSHRPFEDGCCAEVGSTSDDAGSSRIFGSGQVLQKVCEQLCSYCQTSVQLTEKGREFKWTTECDAAFVEPKSQLMSAPILAFPDFSKQFFLDTDASDVGLGAVLSQVHEGNEHVVAYAS